MMNEIQPVILSGGAGTRLWPLSRMKYPKQFVKLSNGKSLFSEALEQSITIGTNNPIIVSNEEYRFYVQESLIEEKQKGDIILESVGRNTAPAIALAALATLEKRMH